MYGCIIIYPPQSISADIVAFVHSNTDSIIVDFTTIDNNNNSCSEYHIYRSSKKISNKTLLASQNGNSLPSSDDASNSAERYAFLSSKVLSHDVTSLACVDGDKFKTLLVGSLDGEIFNSKIFPGSFWSR